MDFVDDEHVEPVAESFHIEKSAGEGSHGDRLLSAAPVTKFTDRLKAGFTESLNPLRHEHARRNQAEGPKPGLRHRRDRCAGLPGTCRKDDDASPTGALPRRNCGSLV